MKRLLLLVAAATFISPVHAGGCAEEMIRSVVCGGSIVFFDSGAGRYFGHGLWNAGDDVLVCGDEEMIDQDSGDKVHVTPTR